MDTRWKRRNSASLGQVAAFALVLATNPVLAFVVCQNLSSSVGIPLLLLSCAVCLVCTVFLFIRTGRVRGSEDILLGESGALPTEVPAAVFLLMPLLGTALATALGTVYEIMACIATVGGGVMLLCLLALARKWKAGRLIADSLLARAWPTLRGALRFAGRAARGAFTGENYLNVHYPAGQAWVRRILWVCGAMAGLVVLSYLILSNQLLGVGDARWFGAGRYTAFALFAIVVVATGAGYLVWRAYRDAQSFDALLRQLDVAATGAPAPVCVPEDSGLYPASRAVADIGTHLQESVAAQMKSERMKLDLITNVSHDLKTPLTSIIGYLDLLEKQNDLPAGTRDYVLILRQKSERLATTVSDLFTLAKATSGSEALSIEPLDLVMAVRQTLGDMNDAVRRAGVPVKATMPASAIVQADSGKLYRVLQNILDNALRYSLAGTRIYLAVSRGDIATRLTLTNTASYEMNFAPDDVLQRFVRGDASRTTEGSGLGLSIAQSFMQNFGGGLEIDVHGDAFTVTLTFPGSAAAEGAGPLAATEVFGAAETDAENDSEDAPSCVDPACESDENVPPDISVKAADAANVPDTDRPAPPKAADKTRELCSAKENERPSPLAIAVLEAAETPGGIGSAPDADGAFSKEAAENAPGAAEGAEQPREPDGAVRRPTNNTETTAPIGERTRAGHSSDTEPETACANTAPAPSMGSTVPSPSADAAKPAAAHASLSPAARQGGRRRKKR